MGTFVCSGDATRIFFGLTTYVSWGATRIMTAKPIVGLRNGFLLMKLSFLNFPILILVHIAFEKLDVLFNISG